MRKEFKKLKDNNSITKILVFILAIFVIIIVAARYTTDEEFRSYIDTNIFKRQVEESTLNTIEIDSDANPSIYAYDKYIAVLNKNTLTEYSSEGNVIAKLDVNISVPLVDTNEKYMVLAEDGGQRVYLISGSNILWTTTVEGSISRVDVNKNGYVSIVITDTIYKSVVAFFDLSGKELFRNYVPTNYAVCTSISTNNEYLAIGEIDYSGTIIKSYVKIISADLAQTDPENSTIYIYEAENGEIITNINYQDKDIAVCMFNSYIQKVTTDSNERLYDITGNDLFIDINLKEGVAIIDKQSSGLFSYEYEMTIKNPHTKSDSLFILDSDLPKTISVSGNVMALNLGNEVKIVNSSGWPLKNYTSSKQIKGLVVGDSIAGIIYKNKIEIVKF